jgi:hypothetical protein
MRLSVAAEKAGIPAVSIIAAPFLTQARAFAKGLGVSQPMIAAYPDVPALDTDEQVREKALQHVLPQILEGLNRRSDDRASVSAPKEAAPRDIVFRGTYDQVQDFFEQKCWADGLPVAPPTIARIEEFLKFTDRSPDEVIGVAQPENREVTIWNIAVNGVMAGCRPEYMPILIAAVEAMIDPAFMLEDGGTTPGWEPIIILNGPIIKELGFNFRGGVLRIGRRPNSSIGRFVRLFIRNVPGQRIPEERIDPATGNELGGSDKTAIGMTFNAVLAENEDVVAELGWEPFSVDQGFAKGENIVTLQSVMSISQPAFTAGRGAQKHMDIIVDVLGPIFYYRSFTGIQAQRMYPLLVMGPSVAKAIAADGWTKADIRKYLFDRCNMTAEDVERYAQTTGGYGLNLRNEVARGTIPKLYHESDDPKRIVPALIKPEMIGIVVAGDPGRNQTRAYPQNAKRGVPVSRRIVLPANWKALVEKSRGG